ncbi:putative F-box domain, FIST, C-domain, F-box-like domain superfamily protein [Helianthus anomalus]
MSPSNVCNEVANAMLPPQRAECIIKIRKREIHFVHLFYVPSKNPRRSSLPAFCFSFRTFSEMLRSRTTSDDLSIDLVQNIFGRLPAVDFASADCVSRSWHHACRLILRRPKLSSACSFNPDLEVAVESVVNKVLSEPIRPQFAIASVCRRIDLSMAHQLITEKLGSNVPVITNCSRGVIGRDAISDEFKEWEATEDSGAIIMLMVGYLPGIKVKTIPLLQPVRIIGEINNFSNDVSGSNSPAAIIIFSEHQAFITAAVATMDYIMSPETVIVGDYECEFEHTIGYKCVAVALVFVKYRNRPRGIGETQFHAVLSSGLLPIGHAYKVTHFGEDRFRTWLTAKREGSHEVDAKTIWKLALEDLRVPASLRVFIGLEKVGCTTPFAFHEYYRNSSPLFDESRLRVGGIGIKRGDTFRFYRPDTTTALSSVANVSNHLRSFKQERTSGDNKRWEVFGGLIFNSCDRRQFFYDQPNIDSSPFLDNFPGVTLGGIFCSGEVGRGYVQESQEQKWGRCCLHAFSAVNLIMSYRP